MFKEEFRWNPSARGWGGPFIVPKGYRAFVMEEIKVIKEYLGKCLRGIFCDVSGGAGNYSLLFSKEASLTVHCDLDVNSINHAYERSRRYSCARILFVRCDYLQLPFASNIFDSIICLDTLERGLSHEIRLLREIERCLKRGGRFVIDFHNKLRMPSLLMPKKQKKEVVGWDRTAIQKMLSAVGLKRYSIKSIGYAPIMLPSEEAFAFLDKAIRLLLVQPSRFIVFGEKDELE
jgi:ubiquinone/menaquinone biosynthesis C-methylase UbiE